jgi:hypothetical protein
MRITCIRASLSGKLRILFAEDRILSGNPHYVHLRAQRACAAAYSRTL